MNGRPPDDVIVTDGPSLADYPRGARMGPRTIEDFEFVWMLRGQARLVTDDRDVGISPGQLLLVTPDVRHGLEWDRRRASRHGYVHFRPGRAAISGVPVAVRSMTEHDPLAGLCAHLICLGLERPAGWGREAARIVAFLFPLFVSGPLPEREAQAALPVPLSAAADHLRREWAEMPFRSIRVEELSAAAGVSRSYLNRRFRAELEACAVEGLERLRLSRAETLLIRTDMTVAGIAAQCGFADLYHLSHRFGRRYGVSPRAYRGSRVPRASALDHPGVRRLANAVWG